MVALVDCNNFYASCERVFRPDLIDKPVIVLSNNDGCAIAMSDEAKLLGVKMGSPAFMIENLIKKHQIAVFSSNYTLYHDFSNRITKILSSFVPIIEIYSIDECFLDLSNLNHINHEKLASEIKQTIKQWTGIPVTVGIAKTKTLAKIANRFAKKTKKHSGIHVLDTQEKTDEALQSIEIGKVWGIGRQYEKMLLKQCKHCCGFR